MSNPILQEMLLANSRQQQAPQHWASKTVRLSLWDHRVAYSIFKYNVVINSSLTLSPQLNLELDGRDYLEKF